MTALWPRHGLPLRHTIPPTFLCSRQILVRSSHLLPPWSQQQYATQQQSRSGNASPNDPVKGALAAVSANAVKDPVNAPRSSLPPPLDVPATRDANQSRFGYWLRVGRGYGRFYKEGIKAVWNNWSAAKLLREQRRLGGGGAVASAVKDGRINRAEFQLLARSQYDNSKLPFFGVLALVFGEWLPLLVPFIPNAVPGTCRIPKQLRGMQQKAEERRRHSFRLGILEPKHRQLPSGLQGGKEEQAPEVDSEWSIAYNAAYRSRLLSSLRSDQLLHLSTTLSLHSTLWDRLQLPPPSLLLRRRISARLAYLAQDDVLLLRHRSQTTHLISEELNIACAERGMDVLGKPERVLRESLTWWLQRQDEDKGMGRAMMVMLFRRPKAWDTRAGLIPGRK